MRHVRGPDVLDVGCVGQGKGPGHPLWLHGWIRDEYPDAYGIDLNGAGIDALKDLGMTNLFCADAQHMELDRHFDTIVASEIIEHVADPPSFLAALVRHLKPGGRLVLTTPYAFSAYTTLYAWRKFPQTCTNPEHVAWYCPTTLNQLVDRVGLRVLEWELVPDYDKQGGGPGRKLAIQVIEKLESYLPRRLTYNCLLAVIVR